MEDKLPHIDENQIKSALRDILFTRIHSSLVRAIFYRDFFLTAGKITARCDPRKLIEEKYQEKYLDYMKII